MQLAYDATKRKTAHSAVKSSMKIKNDEQHIACMYEAQHNLTIKINNLGVIRT